MKILNLTALATIYMLASPFANAADWKILVEAVKSDDGEIRAALWDNAEGFPGKGEPMAVASVAASATDKVLRFENLAAGTYAVSLYHDENNNNKLDKKFTRLPKEGMGFSNNAVIKFGPPSFEDAAIQVGKHDIKTQIKVSY